MLFLSFFESNHPAVFFAKFGIANGDRWVHAQRMPQRVSEEMGHGPERKGVFIFRLSIAQNRLHEIPAANIVEQIREEEASEGIVAEVLNDRTAVGIASSFG